MPGIYSFQYMDSRSFSFPAKGSRKMCSSIILSPSFRGWMIHPGAGSQIEPLPFRPPLGSHFFPGDPSAHETLSRLDANQFDPRGPDFHFLLQLVQVQLLILKSSVMGRNQVLGPDQRGGVSGFPVAHVVLSARGHDGHLRTVEVPYEGHVGANAGVAGKVNRRPVLDVQDEANGSGAGLDGPRNPALAHDLRGMG